MRVDLRVKHDIEARKAAIGLFELGHGYKSAAIALSLPAEAVRRWQEIYRAFGSEVLLRMDGKQGRYTYEQKAAGGRRDLLAHCQRLRAPADSDVPQGGRGGRDSRQDRARDDARDVDSLRYQTRDGLPQVQLVQGRRRQDVRERDREGFRRRGPVAEAGNGRHRVQGGGRQGLLGPDAGLLHQGDCGERHIDHARHGPAGQDARRAAVQDPRGAAPTMHSDRGWQYQHASYTSRLEAAGIVQSMSRKANCIDNAATEQLFGHVKDEFYRGREWETFEDFKRDLEEYIVHWNTSRRQVRLKGLTPEEFRNQALAA